MRVGLGQQFSVGKVECLKECYAAGKGKSAGGEKWNGNV